MKIKPVKSLPTLKPRYKIYRNTHIKVNRSINDKATPNLFANLILFFHYNFLAHKMCLFELRKWASLTPPLMLSPFSQASLKPILYSRQHVKYFCRRTTNTSCSRLCIFSVYSSSRFHDRIGRISLQQNHRSQCATGAKLFI